MIKFILENKEFAVSVALAIATFLAVGVALFQEKIKYLFGRARLEMKINLFPPDCQQISLRDLNTGEFLMNCIYLRIRVNHLQGSSAENVEVMLSNFWKINGNETKTVLKEFLPMNLTWSHFQPRTHVIKIAKSMFRHCDLGYIVYIDGKNILKLDTITQPNVVSGGLMLNTLDAGRYEFELLLSGD